MRNPAGYVPCSMDHLEQCYEAMKEDISQLSSGLRGRYATSMGTKASLDASRHAIPYVTASTTSVSHDWKNPLRKRLRGRVCLVFADFRGFCAQACKLGY